MFYFGSCIQQSFLSIKGAIKMGTQKGLSEENSFKAKDLLTNAADTISERGLTHGHYDLTMLRTAKLWTDFLEREIDPMDVALCMALLKRWR